MVEATLTELLSAAGFLVELKRREGAEMLFELIGDDVEPLLANKGEGLSGLEVLTGRIAGKRLARPVYPRLDAEGFRAHQRESLEELARRSADEPDRTPYLFFRSLDRSALRFIESIQGMLPTNGFGNRKRGGWLGIDLLETARSPYGQNTHSP